MRGDEVAGGLVPPDPLIDVRDLAKRYPNGTQALTGVNVQVWPGELVAVLGANGSGKSTMLRCAVRLLEPSAGTVRIAGHDLTRLSGRSLRDARRAVGMVFQQVSLVRRRSALANAASGCLGRRRGLVLAAGGLPRDELARAWRALERVGMTRVAHQRASSLSGGQAQRVAVARALVQEPRVILADEPVASLDPEAAEDVLSLLRRLASDEALAVCCVLHQPDLALRHADRIVALRDGRVAFDRPVAAVSLADVAPLYRAEAAELT